jgi:uncharacterized membrane protein
LTIHLFSGMFSLHFSPVVFSNHMSSNRITYRVLLSGTVAWCSLIVLAPFCASSPGVSSRVAQFIYALFHPICHQLDDRSFHLLGHPFGVCIRCTAIYGSFLAGVLLYPMVRSLHEVNLPSRRTIGLCLLPMVLDVAASVIGLHPSSTITRVFTGSIAGTVLAFAIVPAALEGVREMIAQAPFHIQKG